MVSTPVGSLVICASDAGVKSIEFDKGTNIPSNASENCHSKEATTQLLEYFNRERKIFKILFDFNGQPEFYKQVWKKLLDIGYGETSTYLKIAQLLGNSKAVRAVGMANGKNPVAIVVPCHRIIGTNGRLTGYAGGLPIKRWLLDFENETKVGDQMNLFKEISL